MTRQDFEHEVLKKENNTYVLSVDGKTDRSTAYGNWERLLNELEEENCNFPLNKREFNHVVSELLRNALEADAKEVQIKVFSSKGRSRRGKKSLLSITKVEVIEIEPTMLFPEVIRQLLTYQSPIRGALERMGTLLSTKPNSHGRGLVHCINYAREAGGRLLLENFPEKKAVLLFK